LAKFFRRVVFKIHLWTGLGVGLYIVVVCGTGAALVFRPQMQTALYPALFDFGGSAVPGPQIPTVLREVSAAYPEHQVVGVYVPTPTRQSYLAYIVKDQKYSTILAHPVTGRVVGTLPEESLVRSLQELHFNLLVGRRGRFVNGLGACLLLVMCVTGLVIWWPGIFKPNFRTNWKRLNWEVHNVVGFWTASILILWAVSGIYLSFPALLPASATSAAPRSDVALKDTRTPLNIPLLVSQAEGALPDAELYGLMLPAEESGAFAVVMAQWKPYQDNPQYSYVYFDQFSGELLTVSKTLNPMSWLVTAHVGGFGGVPVKVVWAIFGLSPVLLFATGLMMWWKGVIRR
jgi:uncharacterized iron-regulated membrane protein